MDEARHGGAYLKYMKKSLKTIGASAQLAFAKIGVLMASANQTSKGSSSDKSACEQVTLSK